MPKRKCGESPELRMIFRMIEQGKSHRQIVDTLDDREHMSRLSDARGKDSELNVLRALRKLWYVTHVSQIGQDNPNHDHDSHDLSVTLDAISCLSVIEIALQIPKNMVFVEVKSSDVGLQLYKQRTMWALDLASEEEYWHLMRKKKTIILNGQNPDDVVQDLFLDQLKSLNLAWATRNT